jgi:hypothetical protein
VVDISANLPHFLGRVYSVVEGDDPHKRLAEESVEALVAVRLVTLLLKCPLVQLLQTKAENMENKNYKTLATNTGTVKKIHGH